ncbi:MAG: hypothetical protein ACJ75M_22985 [Actinomycetes bacterium]|jgi:hypothetical protein
MAIGTGRSRHAGELVERWLEWRQQVRPISPVTVANHRGAIDRYILPNRKCRHCWKRIRRGEPALRAVVGSGATSARPPARC